MKKVAIIGLGLIGGSLGLAIKQNKLAAKVIGLPHREETIAQALEMGAIDEGSTDLKTGLAEADLVFICIPLSLIIPKLQEIISYLKPGAIVTDVGSVKGPIVSAAKKIVPKGIKFIGGHPMAGKEKFKLSAAEANLFSGRPYILTSPSKKLEKIIQGIGGKLIKMKPKKHDQVVAAVSHLPLAVASTLVKAVASPEGIKDIKEIASSGFFDTTRVASGDPQLGKDIFTMNQKAVLKQLRNFKKALKELEQIIKKGEGDAVFNYLKQAKDFRDQVFPG